MKSDRVSLSDVRFAAQFYRHHQDQGRSRSFEGVGHFGDLLFQLLWLDCDVILKGRLGKL